MKRWERWFVGLGCLFLSAAAQALSPEQIVQACLEDAAVAFNVPALPVKILREVEGGRVGQSVGNRDGSVDLGPMQINSSWLPTLAPLGITQADVRDNACINAYVGVWIFAQAWSESKAQPALAMARYHSHNSAEQARYLGLVLKIIDRRAPSLAQSP